MNEPTSSLSPDSPATDQPEQLPEASPASHPKPSGFPERAAPASASNDLALQPGDWSLQRNIAFHMASIIFRLDQDLRDTVLRSLDLTYAHFRVLQVLYEQDGQTIGDIARAIVVRQPVLSRVITQMQERDLVRRAADDEDSRIMRVFLTAHGRQHYELAWPPAHAIMEDAFSVLSPEERTQMEEWIRRVGHHVNHGPVRRF